MFCIQMQGDGVYLWIYYAFLSTFGTQWVNISMTYFFKSTFACTIQKKEEKKKVN